MAPLINFEEEKPKPTWEAYQRQEKWDNQPCLACEETLLDEGMWNDIPECGGTCNMSCQYTILISDWIKKGTPIEAA
ncbi:hypothetical protein G9A89_006121 [Geosiphon pyriformis]|nr:hypothetical protein G9A89_006121 [Geosiphon pyriformis]